ncbi:MAG TPA: winged helix DNA-binding domain-containing protein [Vicinamibacterales bacterium]|nr:winged helix DNA-binding domain-containing protein [Vicinamibacterales bacterium]
MSVTPDGRALIAERLASQGLIRARFSRAAEVVEWHGAVQAQEYQPSKWALALRMRAAADADVQREIDEGRILRTHVMRPTWHYVAARDLVWMQRLTASRVQRGMQVYWRRMEIDGALLRRAAGVFERALRDGRHLTRADLGARLHRAGIALSGYRLAHAALYAELEAVICSGPRVGKQSTYALVAERAPRPRDLSGDEALAELARRFFRSHGPATARDFAWWSNLTMTDARRGADIIRARAREVDGRTYWTLGSRAGLRVPQPLVHLLPVYDEYVVAYRDRALVPHGPAKVMGKPGYATFQHTVVIDGQVAGTWRAVRTARGVRISMTPMRRLTAKELKGIEAAASRHGDFLGVPVTVDAASGRGSGRSARSAQP